MTSSPATRQIVTQHETMIENERRTASTSRERRALKPSLSAGRNADGRLPRRREPPIVPSGRQDLNLRPLDPQGSRERTPDLQEQQTRRSARSSCSQFNSAGHSLRPIVTPGPLQQRSLQHRSELAELLR